MDLILGGPPCQGFSTHRINDAGVNDPRNTLLLRYFEFVNEFSPKAFLVENVAVYCGSATRISWISLLH